MPTVTLLIFICSGKKKSKKSDNDRKVVEDNEKYTFPPSSTSSSSSPQKVSFAVGDHEDVNHKSLDDIDVEAGKEGGSLLVSEDRL